MLPCSTLNIPSAKYKEILSIQQKNLITSKEVVSFMHKNVIVADLLSEQLSGYGGRKDIDAIPAAMRENWDLKKKGLIFGRPIFLL